jgi:hypothetical protein
MKKILLFLVILLFFFPLFAQEEQQYTFSDEIGVNAGFTTGMGISYRHWTQSGIGIQFTTLPVKTDYVQYISIGVTGLKSVSNGRFIRSFMYLGNHVLWDGLSLNDKFIYNVGAGFGMEIGKYPKVNIMLGYQAMDVTQKLWLVPTVEAGFYFDFSKK